MAGLKKTLRKTKQAALEFAYRQNRSDEAREALGAFLREAVKHGLRCVRVIHGKGLGSVGKEPVLKGKVRRWLAQKEEVIAFCQARAHDGGEGAGAVPAGADHDPD